ncbi:hypothetical protein ACIQMV_04960 [Streptomyces sp. NPDC091412]|uniref:hypothetical protein n=1 Tax=Streptomyces sp. NPDC091412 TaxID=3366002 RepID=UPI0038190CE0
MSSISPKSGQCPWPAGSMPAPRNPKGVTISDAARGTSGAPAVVDVVTLGEPMVTFPPTCPGRLAGMPTFERAAGGAGPDAARALAAAGRPGTALTVPGGLATPPVRHHADRPAVPGEAAWGRLRLGPGRTGSAQGAEEEVRTP